MRLIKKGTVVMWFLCALVAAIAAACTTAAFLLISSATDEIPTKVYTAGDTVISLKIPDSWSSEASDTSVTWTSASGAETLKIMTEKFVSLDSAVVMIPLKARSDYPTADISTGIKTKDDAFLITFSENGRFIAYGCVPDTEGWIGYVYTASQTSYAVTNIDRVLQSVHIRTHQGE